MNRILSEGLRLANTTADPVFIEYNTGHLKKLLCAGKDCRAGTKSLHVNSDGELRPCTFIDDSFFPNKIANMNEFSLEEYWANDTNLTRFRNIEVSNQCIDCEYDCKNSCYSYRVNSSHELLGKNPTCVKEWK